MEPAQNLDEGSCIDGVAADKLVVDHPPPVTEGYQHALANCHASSWMGGSHLTPLQPLRSLHFGQRIIHVDPSFVSCHDLLHDPWISADRPQHQLAALQALSQVVGSQICRNQLCTSPSQLQVFGQNPLYCVHRDVGLPVKSSQGETAVTLNGCADCLDVGLAPSSSPFCSSVLVNQPCPSIDKGVIPEFDSFPMQALCSENMLQTQESVVKGPAQLHTKVYVDSLHQFPTDFSYSPHCARMTTKMEKAVRDLEDCLLTSAGQLVAGTHE